MYAKIVKLIGICLNYREAIDSIPLYKKILFPSIRNRLKLDYLQIISSIKSIEYDNLSISDLEFIMKILYSNKDIFSLSKFGIIFIEDPILHMSIVNRDDNSYTISFYISAYPMCKINTKNKSKPNIILSDSKDFAYNEYILIFKQKIIEAMISFINKK